MLVRKTAAMVAADRLLSGDLQTSCRFTADCALEPEGHLQYFIQVLCGGTAKLARDPRFIGGDIGMMGGLHTWRRDMGYHPHVHFIVPGGGLLPDRQCLVAFR